MKLSGPSTTYMSYVGVGSGSVYSCSTGGHKQFTPNAFLEQCKKCAVPKLRGHGSCKAVAGLAYGSTSALLSTSSVI